MDRTNKITLAAIAALALIIVAMLRQHDIRLKQEGLNVNRVEEFAKQYELKIARNTKIYKEVKVLVESRKYSEAMVQLEKIIEEYPDNPQSLVYKAQIQVGLGGLAEPIHTYREAVNAEPDYITKKAPIYIGHTIMDLIDEARVKLNREKKLKPGDRMIRIALEDMYYLQSRIAGGCE